MLGFHAVKDSAAEVMADILRSCTNHFLKNPNF
jgi:hypothetical protein